MQRDGGGRRGRHRVPADHRAARRGCRNGLEFALRRGRRPIRPATANNTTGRTKAQGARPIRLVPCGMGGMEPTRVLVAPEGPRPIATTVVPGSAEPVAGKSAVMVPVWSARTATGSWLPNWTDLGQTAEADPVDLQRDSGGRGRDPLWVLGRCRGRARLLVGRDRRRCGQRLVLVLLPRHLEAVGVTAVARSLIGVRHGGHAKGQQQHRSGEQSSHRSTVTGSRPRAPVPQADVESTRSVS